MPRPGRFIPREGPGTHCTGGWVGPRAGLDRCGKSRPVVQQQRLLSGLGQGSQYTFPLPMCFKPLYRWRSIRFTCLHVTMALESFHNTFRDTQWRNVTQAWCSIHELIPSNSKVHWLLILLAKEAFSYAQVMRFMFYFALFSSPSSS